MSFTICWKLLLMAFTVLCSVCRCDHASTMSELLARVQKTERQLKDAHLVCGSCCGTVPAEPVKCESLDCPWMYERKKLESKAGALTTIRDLIEEVENGRCIMDEEGDEDEDGAEAEGEGEGEGEDNVTDPGSVV